jgi:hypothetical protein
MSIGAIASLAFVLTGAVMSVQTPTPADDRKQLEDIQQQLARAWIKRDRLTLERLIAPDWIVTHADDHMSTREEVLCEFDAGTNRLLEARIDDMRVRSFEGFAVVTGRTHARGEYMGQKYDVALRFTGVFVRRNQQWQAVASHACLIAADSSR